MPPLQASSRSPSLFSLFILTPETFSYTASNYFTTFMSWHNKNTVTSSAYVDTFVSKQSAREIPRITGRVLPVTLCRWSAKQTIPFSVLARNQTKGFGHEISAWPEVVRGREKRVGQRNSKLAVGEGGREWPVDTGQQRDQSAWYRVQP